MKNRGLILSIVGITIVSYILVVIVKYNTKDYIMYDSSMLALTIDGSPSTSFPSDTNKYYVDIKCDGGVGEYLPDENSEMKFAIKNISKDGAKCDIAFTTITDNNKSEYLVSNVVKKNGAEITSTNYKSGTDISYRYTGKSPENYVWFNNEMWRIIGLVPVCTTSGCGTPTTSLVKIIRNEPLGSIAYHGGSATSGGIWGKNTLYKLLNNYYYGKLDATGLSGCYGYSNDETLSCDYTGIGISNDTTDYYGKMIKEVYWNTGESGSSKTASEAYASETAKQTIVGKVGVLNASDFGYAASSEFYETDMDEYYNASSSNWLYKYTGIWTMNVVDSPKVVYIRYNGLSNNYSASYSGGVIPVVYLDSSVYIISGEGTESNPYILGM